MEEALPNPPPIETPLAGAGEEEKPKRKYVLARKGRLSQKALSARRANLRKARAAPKQLIYRPTEKRRAASHANLQKAITARKTPEGNAAAQMNALKHDLFAKKVVRDSVARLGEDPREFEEHLRLFEQVYVPEDDEESKLIRRLAETVWRRLRLFHAQARRERDLLKEVFSSAPRADKLTAEETVGRAHALTLIPNDFDAFFRESSKAESQVEYLLRKLLRKRSGGTINYKGFCPRRDPDLAEIEKQEAEERALERWEAMSPEERAALWDEVQKQVNAKFGIGTPPSGSRGNGSHG